MGGTPLANNLMVFVGRVAVFTSIDVPAAESWYHLCFLNRRHSWMISLFSGSLAISVQQADVWTDSPESAHAVEDKL
jgi:hypothetical protein